MKITIICVGKIKEKFYTEAVREYSKRLSRYCTLSITEVADEKTKEQQATDGTLYCAGMIAGEGIIGILLAVFAVVKIDSKIILPFHLPQVGSLVLYIALLVLLYVVCMKADKEK